MAADFFIGESLVGDGNEIAHIDLIIGSKSGPAGAAFTNALSNNTDGFTTLLAVVTPNLPCKPDTLLFNKVTIKGAKQAVQMFGPAQAAVARAVMDSVNEGVIPKSQANDFCILVGVFIHWQAEDDKKIYALQLPGGEGVDRPGAAGQADGRRGARRSTRPRGIRSPAAPRADRTVPRYRRVRRGAARGRGRPSSFSRTDVSRGDRFGDAQAPAPARQLPAAERLRSGRRLRCRRRRRS